MRKRSPLFRMYIYPYSLVPEKQKTGKRQTNDILTLQNRGISCLAC